MPWAICEPEQLKDVKCSSLQVVGPGWLAKMAMKVSKVSVSLNCMSRKHVNSVLF